MKRIVIFGSTGSIGRGVLSVVRRYPGHFRVVGISGSGQAGLLARQAAEFKPRVVVRSGSGAGACPANPSSGPAAFHAGPEGLRRMAEWPGVDLAVLAIPGSDSLLPAAWCLEAGRSLALASKEALVMSGAVLNRAAASSGARIIPLDSEHNSLFQLLEAFPGRPLEKVYLTASGGPFWKRRPAGPVSPRRVLDHPVWSMGRKVTVDSATMINKALEVIEAHHLFRLPPEKIGVIVHPEVSVHGLVEFRDGFTMACLSPPDMRLAIAAGLFWPGRPPFSPVRKPARPTVSARHTFYRPRDRRFPALEIAYRVLGLGGTAPAVFSVANEEAVEAFLGGRLAFEGIVPLIERVLEGHRDSRALSLESVLDASARARARARSLLAAGSA